MGRPPKVIPPRRPNPLKGLRSVREPTPLVRKAVVTAAAAVSMSKPAKRACPNKECSDPKVEEGICHNCGTIIDDSNIVAEIQFGESSNGAAVVQGSFVSADQGAAKSLGPAFRRAGGSEDRESTVREGKRIMQALANQLQVPESVVNSGVQIFKLAAMNNFIQGRRMDMVVAVCLYSACRKEKPCRVMLIDFADKVQVNVFKLGHTFKALHASITLARDGILPVLPEDLIYRFATKLEFGLLTTKVAEDAVRMVQRMSLDWMVMGRRPSGVCGACLIMAARMNNFRRTVTELVFVVKVTTNTIQKRLDEFKATATSALTIDEFLNNEFLESAHDPPSFYEKSDEFVKNKNSKKRKRTGCDPIDLGEDESENGDAREAFDQNKRPRSADASDSRSSTPSLKDALPTVELRRDADGFAIPPTPAQSIPIDPDLVDNAIDDQAGTSFDKLVEQYGEDIDGSDELTQIKSSRGGRSGKRIDAEIHVPEAWARMERELEEQISEIINDPHTETHAIEYAKASKRAQFHMLAAETNNPHKFINMDVHIGEDEFADDPEVMNCVLPPEEVAKKEKVWVNENKSWLRKQQLKLYQKKIADAGPPKAKRNRKKKPRIGEGQTSAASSPAEAAVNVLKERTWSKKINYDAIRGMFEGPGSGLGSAATSRVTSRAGSTVAGSGAGSEMGDDESEIGDSSVAAESVAGDSEADPSAWKKDIGNNLLGALHDEDDYDEDMAQVDRDMDEMFEDD